MQPSHLLAEIGIHMGTLAGSQGMSERSGVRLSRQCQPIRANLIPTTKANLMQVARIGRFCRLSTPNGVEGFLPERKGTMWILFSCHVRGDEKVQVQSISVQWSRLVVMTICQSILIHRMTHPLASRTKLAKSIFFLESKMRSHVISHVYGRYIGQCVYFLPQHASVKTARSYCFF